MPNIAAITHIPWGILAKVGLAVLAVVGGYVGLRWLAFQRYKKRIRGVVKREALSMERQRIAMDVHDDLGADLSNLLLRVRMALQAGTDPRIALTDTEHGLTDMMRKIDEIIWSLDPRHDTLSATIAFIEQQAGMQVNNVGLTFRSSVAPLPFDRRLSAGFRRDLLLLVKEALNNVFKHAKATEVHLSILLQDERLRIVVEDDGLGIHYRTRPTDRHGTGNMQRRGVMVKGDVRILPKDPTGTRCEILVPVPENHP
jgi:signal transduction histidine kinase